VTPIEAAIAQTPGCGSPLVANPLQPAVLMTCRNPLDYSAVWSLQQEFHAERLLGNREDTLVLLQHLPVYTAGRRTRPLHLHPEVASSDDLGIPVVTVNRGGSVTYHGPGQLVAYPILALSRYARGAKAYVHMLEEVLIRTLRGWDIHGYRVARAPGIWSRDRQGEAKIASIGARIDRGITLHGFALNVTNDLVPFSRIVPCGLEGCRMTSMAQIRHTSVSVDVVAEELAKTFSTVFHIEWTHASLEAS
jgi:lipoyl(octanoyl) transferase